MKARAAKPTAHALLDELAQWAVYKSQHVDDEESWARAEMWLRGMIYGLRAAARVGDFGSDALILLSAAFDEHSSAGSLLAAACVVRAFEQLAQVEA